MKSIREAIKILNIPKKSRKPLIDNLSIDIGLSIFGEWICGDVDLFYSVDKDSYVIEYQGMRVDIERTEALKDFEDMR